MIEEKVKDILKKYRNLEQKKDWKNQKLLGNDLKFSARDLINVYVELEKFILRKKILWLENLIHLMT